MPNYDPFILHQEVKELTALLRDDPSWADLRHALQSKQLVPNQIALAGFFEDESSNEYGVVVTSAFEIFTFQRDTSGNAPEFVSWRSVADAHELVGTFAAMELGIELTRHIRS